MQRWFVQSICLSLAWAVAGSLSAVSAHGQQSAIQNPSSGAFTSVRRPIINPSYIVRVIKAAENKYHQSHRRFASWQELYDSGALWDVQSAVDEWRKVAFANGPEAIPGYRLSLIVSAEGAGYSISLRDIASNGCGLSMFSDQNGPVYEGAPLDCPKTVDR